MNHSFYHKAVSAGAGTGKTYALVENYIHALFGIDESGIKKRPENILALTFTQKAAEEMRMRVIKRLSELYAVKDLGRDPLFDKIHHQGITRDEIQKLLRVLPNAAISTFHGFAADILRQEAKAFKLKENFNILMPHEERKLAQDVLRPLILDRLKNPLDPLRNLVARYRLSSGPMSLGLIDNLLACYQKLAELGLGTEFFLKPKEQDKDLLLDDLRAIKEAADCFSVTNDKVLARINEVRDFCQIILKQNLNDEDLFSYNFKQLKTAVKGNFGKAENRRRLVDAIDSLGAHAVDHFMVDDENALLRLLKDFHESFNKAKEAVNKLSYNDLLYNLFVGLAEYENVRNKVKKKYLHILIDEYQDTSLLQEHIISYLCEDKNKEQRLSANERPLEKLDFNNGSSLFVVGDKKQSIYAFRGADIALFDSMLNKMALSADKGVFKRHLLTINRRSFKNIIKLTNLVSHYSLKKQGYEQGEDLEPFLDNEGQCSLWLSEDDKGLDKTEANLRCAAHGVAVILNEQSELCKSDITILVRRTRSATALKAMLTELGIKSRIIGGEGFYQRQEIADIIAALKLIHDPYHTVASAIVLRSPLMLFSESDLLAVFSQSLDQSLHLKNAMLALEKDLLSTDAAQKLTKFLTVLNTIKDGIAKEGVAWAMDELISSFDLSMWYGLMDDAEQAYHNMQKLRAMAAKEKRNPALIIEDYFHHIFNNHKEAQALCGKDSDSVTIMTIHQSKGLEFDTVILADLESSLPIKGDDILADQELGLLLRPKGKAIEQIADNKNFPTKYKRKAQAIRIKEEEELARLLYVALTRAKSQLYIVSSRASFDDTSNNKSLLGIFLLAYRTFIDQCSSLCPLREIKPSFLVKKDEAPLVLEQGQRFLSNNSIKRSFSSSLLAPKSWSFTPPRTYQKPAKATIDGSLAHKLLAHAGVFLAGYKSISKEEIAVLVDAAFRSLLPYKDTIKAEDTKLAVISTLSVLHPLFLQSTHVIFELPILCWPHQNLLIEGIADLVIDFKDYIGIVEFKSSLRLANDPNTYMQIFAYAEGLMVRKKPIKFASVFVGGNSPVVFNHYDKACQQAFREGIILDES